ncbi:hypothetical protein PSHT_09181, partial [Puccinia striiformis]
SPDLPSLPTALDIETCVKKGRCPMIRADSSQKPRSLYYEIHGDLQASQKVVMTMHFTCSAWASQVSFSVGKRTMLCLSLTTERVELLELDYFPIAIWTRSLSSHINLYQKKPSSSQCWGLSEHTGPQIWPRTPHPPELAGLGS